MKTTDRIELAFSNLWRTKLRTFLTTLGVVVGIGALVSMVSFGAGMQKNITSVFEDNDLFTSLYVTATPINISDAMHGDPDAISKAVGMPKATLGDSALAAIRALPGVLIAFPEIQFPVRAKIGDKETNLNLYAVPKEMKGRKPFDAVEYGRFFESDSETSVVLNENALKHLGFILQNGKTRLSIEDSLRGNRLVDPKDLIGRVIEIKTAVIDLNRLMENPFQLMKSPGFTPTREETTRLVLVGIQKQGSGFDDARNGKSLIVPTATAQKLPRMGFNSVWDILGKKQGGYGSIYVRVKSMNQLAAVKQAVLDMGFGAFALADQLEEIKKGFLVVNAALGAIGAIALFVASIGIINTMLMSILERIREIGVMKAIGGSEGDIKGIFVVEAGVIGFMGGILGLGLAWVVTRIANVLANYLVIKGQTSSPINFFDMPAWLLLGAVGFAVAVSLIAGLYPADRASRVDPVHALRHD
jgi:putative ABC transport system permease protein